MAYHGIDHNCYVVYDRKDNLLAIGTRDEIIKQLNWSRDYFSAELCRTKHGYPKYRLIIQVEDDE